MDEPACHFGYEQKITIAYSNLRYASMVAEFAI